MTCIVGLEDHGRVIIGADSAAVDMTSYDIHSRSDTKVFVVKNSLIIGFTHSFRMGQLLHYAFTPPENTEAKDDIEFLATDFIDAVRNLFKDKGFMKKSDEVEEGGIFLMGYNGRLYIVEEDFQVGRSMNGYDAVGCGGEYALGSMYSTIGKSDSIGRVKLALEAAAHHNAGVRPPFVIQAFPFPLT